MIGVFDSVVDYSWGLIGCLIGVCWGGMNKGGVHHLQLAAVRTMIEFMFSSKGKMETKCW